MKIQRMSGVRGQLRGSFYYNNRKTSNRVVPPNEFWSLFSRWLAVEGIDKGMCFLLQQSVLPLLLSKRQ